MAKTKILLIDDEEEICFGVKMNLEDTGHYEVMTETKGSMGLKVAKEFKPDLIILDFRMPDMHGTDVALQLQSDQETADIPIIFLTGLATSEDLEQHGSADMCNVILAKPASTKQIITAIENNLGKRSSLSFLQSIFNKKKDLTWGQDK